MATELKVGQLRTWFHNDQYFVVLGVYGETGTAVIKSITGLLKHEKTYRIIFVEKNSREA